MFFVFGGTYLTFEGNVFGIYHLPSAAPGLPIRWLSQQLDYSTHANVPTLQHPPPPPSSPHRHHHRDPTLSLIVGHRSQLHKPLSHHHKVALVSDCQSWRLVFWQTQAGGRYWVTCAPELHRATSLLHFYLPTALCLTCYVLYFCISVFVFWCLYFSLYFVISVFPLSFLVLYIFFLYPSSTWRWV